MLLHCSQFWRCHPALLYGLACLLGCFMALEASWLPYIPLFIIFGVFFWADRDMCIRFGLALGVVGIAFFYVTSHYTLPELPSEGVFGEGVLRIESLSKSTTHFGSFWVYKGALKTFAEGRNIPVRITLPQKKGTSRPLADRDYKVQGVLIKTPGGSYALRIERTAPWHPVKGSYNLAERRYAAKRWVTKIIRDAIHEPRSATFLAGIATGDFEDRLMQFEFGRFGLQHIMAISGFHFAILAGFFSFGLRLMLNRRVANAFLIALLSTYFVFLGAGPSILRAWMTILITLGGYFLEKRGSGLNSLGVVLLLILFYDPLLCQSVGFQFSFVATAAILCFYEPFDKGLQTLFPKRLLSQTIQMNSFNQHSYVALTFIRQALALTFAVNLVTLPLMLFYFHKFALMGLVYNLFFPFLVSIAMLLLILGFFCPWLHSLNSVYTSFMLDFTYNMPSNMDAVIRMDALPAWVVVLFLSSTLLAAIWVKQKRPSGEWAFI